MKRICVAILAVAILFPVAGCVTVMPATEQGQQIVTETLADEVVDQAGDLAENSLQTMLLKFIASGQLKGAAVVAVLYAIVKLWKWKRKKRRNESTG
jgi:hypothetical protein